LTTVYDYAWQHGLSVESSNFLHEPKCLRIDALPKEMRTDIILQLRQWITDHPIEHEYEQVINTRDPQLSKAQLIEDLKSYINYLTESDHDRNFGTQVSTISTKIRN